MAATPPHINLLRRPAPEWMAIGLGLVGTAWMVLSVFALIGGPDAHQNQASPHKQPPAIATAIDIAAVRSLNLFGTVPVEKPVDAAALPATTLNLSLSGIIAGAHPEQSRALIAEAGKPTKAYFTGDKLADGANLYSIDANFVVLQRGDRLEKLPLYRVDPVIVPQARQRPATATETASIAPPPTPLPEPLSQETMGLDERIATIRKKNET